jgi:hypothetical protein
VTLVTAEPRQVSRRPTAVARLMMVLPDAAAIQRVAGSLGYLSARKYRVHVGVHEDPPGAPSLELFHARYPGLFVARLPIVSDDRWSAFRSAVRSRNRSRGGSRVWRTLSALERAVPSPAEILALLQDRKPDLLMVTRLGGEEARHLDYLKAGRALGIRTVFVALECDDVALGRLGDEPPDCVALWNRVQRREAIEQGVPARRTCIVGAHLQTDVLDSRAVPPRDEYCRALGVDPARPLVLLAPPVAASNAREWVEAWSLARMTRSEAVARESAVIVCTRSRDAAAAIAAGNLPGVAAVVDLNPDQDRYAAALRLHEAASHADAVITAEADIALEAIARARAVVAIVDRDAGPLARLCARMRSEYEWPLVARSLPEQLDRLAGVLGGAVRRDGLAAARGFVRIHGQEIEPAFLLISRVIREIPPPVRPEPTPSRHMRAASVLAAGAGALARPRPRREPKAPADGKRLFLLALPAVEGLGAWESLMRVLVSRGHRVVVAFAPVRMGGGTRHPSYGIHGVGFAGDVAPRRRPLRRLAAGLSGVELLLPIQQSDRSATAARWRSRLDGASVPAWVRGIQSLAGRDAALRRVERLAKALDCNLPPSGDALRLVDRVRPDVVLALPALDPETAVESWSAHADILRAARVRGIPAAASVPRAGAIDESLAQCALRARGLSRSNAAIAAGELEAWLERTQDDRMRSAPRSYRAVAAAAALAVVVWTEAVMCAVETTMRPLARLSLRARAGVSTTVRRIVGSEADDTPRSSGD